MFLPSKWLPVILCSTLNTPRYAGNAAVLATTQDHNAVTMAASCVTDSLVTDASCVTDASRVTGASCVTDASCVTYELHHQHRSHVLLQQCAADMAVQYCYCTRHTCSVVNVEGVCIPSCAAQAAGKARCAVAGVVHHALRSCSCTGVCCKHIPHNFCSPYQMCLLHATISPLWCGTSCTLSCNIFSPYCNMSQHSVCSTAIYVCGLQSELE